MTVREGVLEEFDRQYAENCDNLKMSYKMRGISLDNPFNPKNKPVVPKRPYDVLDKIGKPSTDVTKNNFPEKHLAGKYSEIGQRLFAVGQKKAGQIMTGPWGEIQILESEK